VKLIALLLVVAACGDNLKLIDAGPKKDGAIDAQIPAPPTLGAQIDRFGRPAINTALNGTFLAAGAAKTAQKDAYNHASDASMWLTTQVATNVTVVKEFASNIAVFDVIDQGAAGIANAGCGNTALYNAPPGPTSYNGLASVLGDDELYIDTTKQTCEFYLSLEVEVATGGSIVHTQCGGRTPTHDVIDTSYSVLAAGTNGFDPATFSPRLGDNVGPHADVSDTDFPFLGVPH